MKKLNKTNILLSISFFLIFIIYTLSVKFVDVDLIGNKLTPVGFSSLNEIFFNAFSKVKYDGLFVDNSFQMICYNVSEILGYLALLVAVGFAVIGAFQFLNYRSIKKVNKNIYAVGGFYAIVLAFYVFFEIVIVNYRPVLMPGSTTPEASYPSSHTILTLCFLASALMILRYVLKNLKKSIYIAISSAFYVIMLITVLARLVSGVHWFTDILGGILLSIALLMSFKTVVETIND